MIASEILETGELYFLCCCALALWKLRAAKAQQYSNFLRHYFRAIAAQRGMAHYQWVALYCAAP